MSNLLLTNAESDRWHLTYGNDVLDVVEADNQPMAALEVAHLVPGHGEWEQLNQRQYRYSYRTHYGDSERRRGPYLRHR